MKRFRIPALAVAIAALLVVAFQNFSAPNSSGMGVSYWGDVYSGQGWDDQVLPRGASILYNQGFQTIRLPLAVRDSLAAGGSSSEFKINLQPQVVDFLKALLETTQYRTVLGDSRVKNVVFVGYDAIVTGDGANLLNGTGKAYFNTAFLQAHRSDIVESWRRAAYSLLTTSAYLGKTFVFSNWESDNDILCGTTYGYIQGCTQAQLDAGTCFKTNCRKNYSTWYGGNLSPYETADAMQLWFQYRQEGIQSARNQAGNTGVIVQGGIEFNTVNQIQNQGAICWNASGQAAACPTALNYIVPRLNASGYGPDVVTYSSYDSTSTGTLVADIPKINSATGGKPIIISEYGFDEKSLNYSALPISLSGLNLTPDTANTRATAELYSLLQSGQIRMAIIWNAFQNGPNAAAGAFGLFDSTSGGGTSALNAFQKGIETPWFQGSTLPGGAVATGDEAWSWVSSNPAPFTGNLAHQSIVSGGEHQHYFYNAYQTMSVGAGETLYAYVYIDPSNPPQEIMLQWNIGGSWEHRAFWGSDLIGWGSGNPPAHQNMGPVPGAGTWVRLEVPASLVGAENQAVNGMAFTLYGGRATWDRVGTSKVPAGSGGGGGTPLPTRCEIYATDCPLQPATVFPLNDTYNNSANNQTACMGRARDFLYWCKTTNYVTAKFFQGSTLAQQTLLNSHCVVDIPDCPNYPQYANTALWDDYNSSATNQTSCLARAQDYKSWCASSSNFHSAYWLNGAISAQTDTDPPPVVSTAYALSATNGVTNFAVVGSGFSTTASDVQMNCGSGVLADSVTYQSTGQINSSVTSSTSPRTCSVAVKVGARMSNTVQGVSIPAATPPPSITNGYYAGLSGSNAYITLVGSNFQASGNSLNLVCGGVGVGANKSYESTGQINLYLPTSTSARYCNAQVYSNGQWSNTWSNIYLPAVAATPAISNAYGSGNSGSYSYITILGSNFQTSGNTISNSCGSSWPSYESAGQINIYFASSTSARYCNVQVYSNGQWSNVWYNVYVAPGASPPPYISSAGYGGASGSYSYMTLYGSNFSTSSNTAYVNCGSGYISTYISYQSSGQINLYFPSASYAQYCSAMVYANGQYSNTYYNVYIPGATVPPYISYAGYAGNSGGWDYITMYGSNFGSYGNSVSLYCGGYTSAYISYQSTGQINIYFPMAYYARYCSVQVTYNGTASNTVYNVYVPQ